MRELFEAPQSYTQTEGRTNKNNASTGSSIMRKDSIHSLIISFGENLD